MTRCLFTSLLIGATLAGCGSTSTEETGDGDGTGLAMVGPGGAVVDGPDGARVEIPEGALEQDVEIRISMASTGFPTLNAAAMGPVFALEPHGLEFERPVRVTIPHAGKPAEIAMYTAQPGGQWEALRVDASGRTASAEVSHFSYFFNGRQLCGLAYQRCCCTDEDEDEVCDDPDESHTCAGDLLRCDAHDVCMPACGQAYLVCCWADLDGDGEKESSDCAGETEELVCRDNRCVPFGFQPPPSTTPAPDTPTSSDAAPATPGATPMGDDPPPPSGQNDPPPNNPPEDPPPEPQDDNPPPPEEDP